MGGKRRLGFIRRALGHETLESRSMLAGMVGFSPFQNPLDENDLNGDGNVSAVDVLAAVNAINGGGAGRLEGRMAPPALHGLVKEAVHDFLDADGDGNLSAADPLKIINAVNQGLRGGWGNLPTEDLHPDSIDEVGEDAEDLLADRPFAKVRAVLNEKEGGDVDVFQVTPTKDQLNVALFSRGGGAMSVMLVDPDREDPLENPVGSAETEAGQHSPARFNVDVEAGKTYYVFVQGADETVTGPYGLTVLTYNEVEFTPVTDSPLGEDIHLEDSPTALALVHGHARVISNIDAEGDVDAFEVEVKDGKLIVEAGADFPVTLEITNAAGDLVGSIVTPEGHAVAANVTAAAGPYSITVAAANGTDTGAYRMNVVNAPFRFRPDRPTAPPDLPGVPTLEDIFERLDTGGNNSISLEEFKEGVPLGKTRAADRVFAAWDKNDDHVLSLDELVAGLQHLPAVVPHVPGAEIVARLVTRQ